MHVHMYVDTNFISIRTNDRYVRSRIYARNGDKLARHSIHLAVSAGRQTNGMRFDMIYRCVDVFLTAVIFMSMR